MTMKTGHEFKFLFGGKVEYVVTPDGWHAISPWQEFGETMKQVEVKITEATITSSEFQQALLAMQTVMRVIPLNP